MLPLLLLLLMISVPVRFQPPSWVTGLSLWVCVGKEAIKHTLFAPKKDPFFKSRGEEEIEGKKEIELGL